MSELVTVVNGETVTSTSIIAEGAQNTHEAVIRLVKKYQSDLEEVGQGVRFEIEPLDTAGGVQKREIALLDEPQTTLLFTFMQNTEIVRAFKVKLVKAFYAMRQLVPAGKMLIDKGHFNIMLKNAELQDKNTGLLERLLKNEENTPRIRHNWTPEEDARMFELLKQGFTQHKAGLELGRTAKAICGRLRFLKEASA